MSADRVIAIDPGREKCGLAVVDRNRGILSRQVVVTEQLPAAVSALSAQNDCGLVVIGNQTFSIAVRRSLQALLEAGRLRDIVPVDERGSSEEARRRYWQECPPAGWRRFLPIGLLTPPEPVDDFAAVILAERYFAGLKKGIAK